MEFTFLNVFDSSFTNKEDGKTYAVHYVIAVPAKSCRPNVYKCTADVSQDASEQYENGDKIMMYFDENQRVTLIKSNPE